MSKDLLLNPLIQEQNTSSEYINLANTLSNVSDNYKKKHKEGIKILVKMRVNTIKKRINDGNDLTKYAGSGYQCIGWKVEIPSNYYNDKRTIMRKIVKELNGYEGLSISYYTKEECVYQHSWQCKWVDVCYIRLSWKKSFFSRRKLLSF